MEKLRFSGKQTRLPYLLLFISLAGCGGGQTPSDSSPEVAPIEATESQEQEQLPQTASDVSLLENTETSFPETLGQTWNDIPAQNNTPSPDILSSLPSS